MNQALWEAPLGPELAEAAARAVALRRDLHACPELAFEERRTAAVVAGRLRDLGAWVREGVGGTGVVGLIRGARPGPAVALRADMDALPIEERTGLPYQSRVPGRMHACGHDGHTAILLGAAEVLASLGPRMAGSVKLLFQPAEEPVAGARRMRGEKVMEDPPVAAILALHGWPGLPLGTVDATPGPMMASTDTFDILVTGRGGHAAMPHLAADPVVAAAHLITALQHIVSREVSPLAPAVLTVSSVQAGEAYNVIPAEARLKGTFRALDAGLRRELPQRIRRVAEGVCGALGLRAEAAFHEGCPVMVNDPRVCAAVREAAAVTLGPSNARADGEPSMAAEDFSLYLEEAPGALVRLGLGDAPPLHNPAFDFPDAAVPIGIELMSRAALRLLAGLPPR